MGSLILGIIFIIVAVAVIMLNPKLIPEAWMRIGIIGVCIIIGLILLISSTSLWVAANKGGLITKKFGESLHEGHIIAVNGERGVQSEVLSPGWSFGWWPWLYDLETVDNIIINEGFIGTVTAMDGNPLPEGDVYAPAWDSPTRMIDAHIFMTKGGCKGPQLTVLPPGQYRYNPKLFKITTFPCIDIPVGFVAVVRANAGKIYHEKEDGKIDNINGVPLVSREYRGVWKEPLMPGKYYMHPTAYQIIMVRTTKRVYSYVGKDTSESNTKANKAAVDNSIPVRSMDGFQFPVDVRVVATIEAQNAPSAVALFGDPDSDPAKEGFEILEQRAILPSIRAILRNSAENEKAIQYVNSRSKVEAEIFKKFKEEMAKAKIDVEAVYLANIHLDISPEGKKLMSTQTDKEIAVQQQQMYKQQVLAENERSKQVEAQEAANQKKGIQASQAAIEIEKNNAEAAKNKATGEAAAYEQKVKALGGVENFTKLEIAKMMTEAFGKTWKGDVPHILVSGGGSGELLSAFFAQQLSKQNENPEVKKLIPEKK